MAGADRPGGWKAAVPILERFQQLPVRERRGASLSPWSQNFWPAATTLLLRGGNYTQPSPRTRFEVIGARRSSPSGAFPFWARRSLRPLQFPRKHMLTNLPAGDGRHRVLPSVERSNVPIRFDNFRIPRNFIKPEPTSLGTLPMSRGSMTDPLRRGDAYHD